MTEETPTMMEDYSTSDSPSLEPGEWKEKMNAAGAAVADATRATYKELQDKTLACGRTTDRIVRENPYVALGVAFGLGAILTYLLSRRGDDTCD